MKFLRKSVTVTARYCLLFIVYKKYDLRQPEDISGKELSGLSDRKLWGRSRGILLSFGTERWIKITKSNKKHIEIFFISEE